MKRLFYIVLSLAAALSVLMGFPALAVDYTITINTTITSGSSGVSESSESSESVAGIVSGGGVYASGETATVIATPNEGFDFDGWYGDGEMISGSQAYPFPVLSDRTFEARFIDRRVQEVIVPEPLPETTYTVTFDANGGTGAPDPQTKTQGADLILSTLQPTRTGSSSSERWIFLGWNTVPLEANAGTAPLYPSNTTNVYAADGDITLYAVWESGTGISAWPVWIISFLAVLGLAMILFGGIILRKQKK